MTRLARLSLANRSLVALATVAVIGFGLFATTSLRQELLPSLQLPVAVIVTPYQGASPEIVEREVTEPIEAAIQGVGGLVRTSSTSSNGLSVVQAEFDYGTDVEAAALQMQQETSRIAARLPQGVEPTVQAGSFDDFPVMLLTAAVDGDQQEVAERLRDTVLPAIESIEGVRQAEITGAADERVVIRLDQRAMAARGVSPTAIATALQANGVTIPGGSIADGDRRLAVDVGSQLDSVADLERLYLPAAGAGAGAAATDAGAGASADTGPGGAGAGGVPSPAGQAAAAQAPPERAAVGPAPPWRGGAGRRQARPVRLGDVAEVRLEPEPATTITRTDGRPTLGISVTKTAEGNTVDVSHGVRDALGELEAALGGDAQLTVVFDQAPYIEESIENLTTEGLLGLAFAVLVILVFLLSLRSTIVTAVSIPLSLLIAMLGLYAGGYTLHILTLGGLTVAVGRVVDDSIVVLENIKRHLGYGEERRQAILAGVREVAGAVTASTVTTVAVFLPIAFIGGVVGELFRPFAVTVTIALAASLLVALTLIPVLAYWFMPSRAVEPGDAERVRAAALSAERRSPLQRAYVPVVRWATRHRASTLVLAVLVLAGTVALAPRLETSFLEDDGSNTVTVQQVLPAGASLRRTDEAAKRVEAVLRELDGVESYQVTVGSGGFGGELFGAGGSNQASFSITTDPEIDQPAFIERLRDRLNMLTDVGDLRIGNPAEAFQGTTLEVIVRAPDADRLRDAAAMVERAVAGTDGATDVVNNLAADEPGVRVVPDRARAAALGLSDAQIGQAVRQAFEGQPAGTVLLGGARREVVIRGGEAPQDVEALRELPLPTPTGRLVDLGDVAEVEEVTRPARLTRIDGERSATITATPSASDLGALNARLRQRLDELPLPDGASYELGGVTAEQQEAFTDLGVALAAAIVIVYLVMVATFGSLLQPLILLVSVPFAATGAIGLLLATGTPLGVPSLIGLLMLVGIVVTNAIVLIDLINQYRARGAAVREAVVDGARQRLRPVLMTAVATVCALVPMALGLTGGGVLISKPLAIVVIGGLITSTILTLVLVPTLYAMVEERRERRGRRRAAPRPPRRGRLRRRRRAREATPVGS